MTQERSELTPEEIALNKFPVDMKTESLLGGIYTFDNNQLDRELYLKGLIDSQQQSTALQARVEELEKENEKLKDDQRVINDARIDFINKYSEAQSRIAELERENKLGTRNFEELRKDRDYYEQHAEKLMGLLEIWYKAGQTGLDHYFNKEKSWQNFCQQHNLKP